MEYKALMLDIDGTLIPYDYDALPSKKVITAVKNAQKQGVIICLVTGRAYNSSKHILNALGIRSGIIVTNSGGVVLDIKTKKPLYTRPIDPVDAHKIVEILRREHIEFFLKHNMYDGAETTPFPTDGTFDEVYMIFAKEDYDHDKIVRVFNDLSVYPNLTLHKTLHANPDKMGFNITHAEATKLHGIEIIMKNLDLKREDIIGIGDGYNDFPLLMASGLKVAMGNAIDELKEVADYIAPSVEDDGVADVIEKFILKKDA